MVDSSSVPGSGPPKRRPLSAAQLPLYAGLALFAALALLEFGALGLDEVFPFSDQVLPYMNHELPSLDRSSCGPDSTPVACSLLEKDPSHGNPRLLATCEGQADDARYEAYVPTDKVSGEFRVLVLGGSSVFHYNRRPESLREPTELAAPLGDGEGELRVVAASKPPPGGDSWWKLGDEVVVVGAAEGSRWSVTRGDPNGAEPSSHPMGTKLWPYRPDDMHDPPPPGLNAEQSERSCAQGLIGTLQRRLTELLPAGQVVRVINGSYPGLSSSDLVGLMEHLPAQLAPDLVLIYAGHNEFMDFTYPFQEGDSKPVPMRALARRSHLYRLLLFGLRTVADLRERTVPREGYRPWTVFENRAHLCLVHALDDPQLLKPLQWRGVREDVAQRLVANLRFVVQRARALGAAVVLSKVVSNPRLPPCFGGRQPITVDLGRSVDKMDHWQRLYDGEQALNEADFAAALELFDRVVAADPEAPLGHSGRARALDGLGRHGDAVAAYWEARERTIGDFSSPALINVSLAGLASELSLPLVEAPALFVAADKAAGRPPYHARLIYDEVHPNERGSALLAQALLEAAIAADALPEARNSAPRSATAPLSAAGSGSE